MIEVARDLGALNQRQTPTMHKAGLTKGRTDCTSGAKLGVCGVRSVGLDPLRGVYPLIPPFENFG